MTPEVAAAIEELKESYPDTAVEAEEDGQGGAYITMNNILLGEDFTPATTWCDFHITFQYPRADVYPHFIDATIKRTDGRPFGQGISANHWFNRGALQLSRRSNRLDPTQDSAATKLAKVLSWFQQQ